MMKPTKPSAQICAWINNFYGVHYVCIICIFDEFGRYDLFPILSFLREGYNFCFEDKPNFLLTLIPKY